MNYEQVEQTYIFSKEIENMMCNRMNQEDFSYEQKEQFYNYMINTCSQYLEQVKDKQNSLAFNSLLEEVGYYEK